MKLFDIHSHLNFQDFDGDREKVIAAMAAQGMGTITVGTSVKTSQEAVALARAYKHLYATVGIHPTEVSAEDVSKLEPLLAHPKVVAVGECGLDYFRAGDGEGEKKKQISLFEQQIELAIKYDKPLMVHARHSYGDVADIIYAYQKKYGNKVRGNMHFFTGTVEEGKRFLELGFTLSFPGVITFTEQYDDVVRLAPLNMIMAETDSPYAAPHPYRGKRNSPLYVGEVVKAIARLKNLSVEVVAVALLANAQRVFGIPQ